jgi:vacuolar-type H+-ATPase subunit E/Vma4
MSRSTGAVGSTKFAPTATLFTARNEPTDVMLKAQQAVLETYVQMSRAWISRVQSEVDLWNELAAKMAATRSFPEAVEICQESMRQRIKMIADDGRRLLGNGQEVVDKLTRSRSDAGTA